MYLMKFRNHIFRGLRFDDNSYQIPLAIQFKTAHKRSRYTSVAKEKIHQFLFCNTPQVTYPTI